MAKQAVLARADLEPIDRLEEKIKMLVAMVTKLRADQERAADEHARLTQEIDALRGRLTDAESVSSEMMALRDEREIIRTRVSEMLSHLEGLAV
jgi:regulator of replication initiation timing